LLRCNLAKTALLGHTITAKATEALLLLGHTIAAAEAAKALPEEAQKQIDAAKAEVQKLRLSSAIAKEGAVLGLLDADVAITLIPADAIKVNDKGEITGVKEALEKLKETKPYLFATVQKAATGQRVSGGSAPDGKTAHDEAHEKMYGKK